MLNDNLTSDFLYDNLPGGFISYQPGGKILRVNETLSKWLCLSIEEIYQLNFRSILNKASGLYYSMVTDPLLNLQSTVNEISLTFKSSQGEFDALLNAVSYKDDQGNLFLINATVQKITDRKSYELALLLEKKHADEERRKFEFLSNTVPNQIWNIALDGECIYINKKVRDYFGEQPMSFYTDFGGIAAADRERCQSTWQRCLETGKRFEEEVRLIGVSKKEEWFFICIEPYLNRQGYIESWFGSGTNIHKQKTLQIANYSSFKLSLSSAKKTLDENRQLFINMALNHSHMVRKPLANALGLLQLLEDEDLPETSKHLFNMLQLSIQELDEMIKIASNPLRTQTN
ncbi:PAS domain-containing protein [Pedobacter hartonius]|uniref:PAS domain-containing protein n=1 Tax=Pedobacter hartonius TaxID=425514 RepID=A0A1H3W074_9SPHI|nr:PAS domain-containing protein [Pedobacter hartonius]SDZ80456.1 PAS domain-containing protein [Pedobacter hartonius]